MTHQPITAATILEDFNKEIIARPVTETPANDVIRILAASLEQLAEVLDESAGGNCLYSAIRLYEILETEKAASKPSAEGEIIWGTGICDGVLEEDSREQALINVERFDTRLFRKNSDGGWDLAE